MKGILCAMSGRTGHSLPCQLDKHGMAMNGSLSFILALLGNGKGRTNLVKDDLWWESLVEDRVNHFGKPELSVKAGKVPEH